MKKLNKKQLLEQTALVDRLETSVKVLEAALEAHNAVLSDARDFRDSIVDDQTSYYDDRSETWQEGDAGGAYSDWRDMWENAELEDTEFSEDPQTAIDTFRDDLTESPEN